MTEPTADDQPTMDTPDAAVNPIAKMIARPIEAAPRANELLRGFENAPAVIVDKETAGHVGQLIKMMRTHVKTLEDERKFITAPILEGKKRVDARFKVVTDPLNDAIADLNKRNSVYLTEQARLAKEAEDNIRRQQEEEAIQEAARLEEEGEHEQAADVVSEAVDGVAPIVQKVEKVRGDYGATTALRDHWVCDVEDISKLPKEYLIPNMAVLNKAVRSDGVREIPGCKIWNNPSAVTR